MIIENGKKERKKRKISTKRIFIKPRLHHVHKIQIIISDAKTGAISYHNLKCFHQTTLMYWFEAIKNSKSTLYVGIQITNYRSTKVIIGENLTNCRIGKRSWIKDIIDSLSHANLFSEILMWNMSLTHKKNSWEENLSLWKCLSVEALSSVMPSLSL